VKFVATKKGMTKKNFHPSLFLLFWIRDPRSAIGDPEWVKLRIRDKHPGSATLRVLVIFCFSWDSFHLTPDAELSCSEIIFGLVSKRRQPGKPGITCEVVLNGCY
jgi:hypothetical protein